MRNATAVLIGIPEGACERDGCRGREGAGARREMREGSASTAR